jgi:S-adenosylmethionine synthetase
MVKELGLDKPIYNQLSTFGHFGRNDLNLSWEKLNKVNELKKAVGI